MLKIKFILLALAGLHSLLAAAETVPWNQIETKFARLGGSAHALKQVRCFYDHLAFSEFNAPKPTDPRFESRCYSHRTIGIGSTRYFAIIDYTKSGLSRRFYLVDRETGKVEVFAVAHGRYKSGHINIFGGHLKNTLKRARYFSNEIDSNASSTGFFITGVKYSGNWGKSLVLHGLEKGVNHNACERAIVIHGSDYVSLNSALGMSSGCPMIAHEMIDRTREALGGEKVSEDDISMVQAGGLLFIYGPREAALPANYCQNL